jgi:hypothetical protein
VKAPSRRAIGAIARVDLTDRIRAGVGASLFVQPAVLLFVLIASVVAPSLSSVEVGKGVRTIAVAPAAGDGDVGPAHRLLDEVVRREPRYHLKEVADIDDTVAGEKAAVGVKVGPAGDLRIVVLPTRRASKVTAGELQGSLRRVQLDEAGTAAPVIVRTSLKGSGEAGRIGLANLLPFLVAFQLIALIGDASSRIRGGKTDRSAEVYQVLPVSRLDLVIGRGAVGVGDGSFRLAAMLVIAGALPFVPPSIATFSLPGTLLVVLAVAGLLQVLVATAAGSILGALVRTEGQESAIQAVFSLLLSFGFIGISIGSPGPLPGWLAALPFLGPTFWGRNAFYGAARPYEAVLAIVVSVVTTAACVLIAARSLDRDGVTLRET